MVAEQTSTTGCANHCEHLSHSLTINPPIRVWVCCHCGARREERVSPVGGTLYEQRKHGPFAPDFTPHFGGTDAR